MRYQMMNIRCSSQIYYGTADAGGPVSLYIHYPFCVRKCRYCDFLSGPADEETRQRYLDVLCEEIRVRTSWLRDIFRGRAQGLPEADTIFFGGGTPSLMTPQQLDHLMFVLSSCCLIDDDAEITLECNPGTAGYETLRAFHAAGVNRLSIGVQSFRDEELRLLGRIHSAEEARQCVQEARRAGYANVSLDLMSALPGQTCAQWMENLADAVRLEPEHISAYGLILEEGTPLRTAYEAGQLPALPDEDLDRRMYHDTKTFLEQKGYHRYEISNYARPGYESRHNSGYWTGHPYLGLGLGASSYLILPDGSRMRWSNTDRFEEYLNRPAADIRENIQELDSRDQMAEFMILGLRRMQGICETEFAAEYGKSVDDVYGPVLARYCALGLLERRNGRIAFTEHGIDVSNTVLADFLPD